jgi:nodulation protein F
VLQLGPILADDNWITLTSQKPSGQIRQHSEADEALWARLETPMDDVSTKIIEILRKHMKEPRDDISAHTALTDLKIESLDLAMIVFDIEDTFGIEIPYNANEEASDFKTVGSVVERVRSLAAAKA